MIFPLEKVSVERHPTAHQQITDSLRQQITGGRFPAGYRLPSIEEMAKEFGVSTFTVQTALTPLVEAGLIVRKRRSGTFVAERKKEIRCAAIYYGRNFWGGREMDFYRVLHEALCNELEKEGISHHVWIDSRSEKAGAGDVFTPLCQAVESGEVQCLITPLIGDNTPLSEMKKLPAPSVFIASGGVHNRVNFDSESFLSLSLDQLQKQGCRSIGIIASTPSGHEVGDNPVFYKLLVDLARDRGLDLRNEWVLAPKGNLPPNMIERFGRDSFFKLWDCSSRPDGLMVYSDVVARGVVLAIAERSVSVPHDLKLAIHCNEGVDVLCPFPATWVESSVSLLARTMVSQVHAQFRGERVSPVHLPFRLKDSSVS